LTKNVVTVSEVSKILDVNKRTVINLLARGRFPNSYKIDPLKKNSAFRIPVSDLKNFLLLQRSTRPE